MMSLRVVSVLLLVLGVSSCSKVSEAELMQQAQAAVEANNTAEAVILLKNVLVDGYDNHAARMMLGKIYYDLRDFESAAKEFSVALRTGAFPGDVYPLMSMSLYRSNSASELLAIDTSSLFDVSKYTTLAAQSLVLLSQHDYGAAKEKMLQAVTIGPDDPFVLLAQAQWELQSPTGNRDLGVNWLKSLYEKHPDNVDVISAYGDILRGEGDLEGAVEMYSRALEAAPGDLELHYQRGISYIRLKQFDDAANDVAFLKSNAPRLIPTRYLDGILLYQNGNYTDAIAQLESTLGAGARYTNSLVFIALSHVQLGNLESSEVFIREYLDSHPRSLLANKFLASLLLAAEDGADADAYKNLIDTKTTDLTTERIVADSLLKKGDVETSDAIYARLLEENPDSKDVKLGLAVTSMSKGDHSKSQQLLNDLIEDTPDFDTANLVMIANHLQNQDYQSALKAAEEYKRNTQQSVKSLNAYAYVSLFAEDAESAKSNFLQVLDLDKNNLFALKGIAFAALTDNNFQEALSYYDKAFEADKDDADILISKARIYYLNEDMTSYTNELEQATAVDPQHIEAGVLLAGDLIDNGKFERAASVLAGLPKSDNPSADVYYLLGRAQLARSLWRDAYQTYSQAASIWPDQAWTHLNLGVSAKRIGEIDEMRSAFLKALTLTPDLIRPKLELAQQSIANNDLDKASRYLVQLSEQVPFMAEYLSLQGLYLWRSGQKDEALSFFVTAFERHRSTSTLLQLMRAMQALDKTDNAIDVAKNWFVDHPGDMAIASELAALYLRTGQESEAEKLYRDIIAKTPQDADALNNLAWILRERNTADSIKFAERAVGLDPRSSSYSHTYAVALHNVGDLNNALAYANRAIDSDSKNHSAIYLSSLINYEVGNEDRAAQTLQTLLDSGEDFDEKEEASKLLNQILAETTN